MNEVPSGYQFSITHSSMFIGEYLDSSPVTYCSNHSRSLPSLPWPCRFAKDCVVCVKGLESGGHVVQNSQFFDTLKIQTSLPVEDIKARAEAQEINLRYSSDGDALIVELFISIGISIDETIREKDIYYIFAIFYVDVNRKFRGNTFQPVHDVLPNSSLTERENELAVGFKKYEKGENGLPVLQRKQKGKENLSKPCEQLFLLHDEKMA
ncbi:hypothetical protein OUZ56_024609 [Daphnia magna]|uniref:Glycine cleavage system P-protein N-terminal domain-containing protein n=1 Tax=Daphnia magna TaxID=35525 RepID=A0ABR0B120_9CRUS|nr:hypothetical protein OUZ56_009966 [Daphnia magna]KAK4031083.1 hypothetical protein OUZ56_024609 [Daphnia magna]